MTERTLRGVIAAVATIIDGKGAPDPARSLKLARHLLDNGCDGLNVLGTTGEATSFSREERMGLMSAYREQGLPMQRLMVGTGAAALSDAIALTRHAAELGFAGALVLPPFYYKGVPDDGLAAYIDAIVKATADKPVPIYLYHFPAQSGLPWHIALIRRLRDAHGSRIAGVKDSSGDMPYAREAAKVAPDFDVFPSTEACLIEARGGAFAGCISATANCNADLCQQRLAHRRCLGARQGGRDPLAVRRQAAGRRHQGAARPYPRRPGLCRHETAAGAAFGRGPGRNSGRI